MFSRFTTQNAFSFILYLFRLEIIGRFAKAEEATTYNICPTIPVWLSTREDASQFDNENIAERLHRMREELSLFKLFLVEIIFLKKSELLKMPSYLFLDMLT